MENELIENIARIHTTPLGAERIRRNLSLDNADPVHWCRAKIQNKNAAVKRQGKNWYIQIDDCIITVNAGSYTIITAHRLNIKGERQP